MQNLEKRVAALESASPRADEMTIIRRIVSPENLGSEIDHIYDDDGNEWTRQPLETEDAFTERATCETQPNKWGVRRMIASNRELHHADD